MNEKVKQYIENKTKTEKQRMSDFLVKEGVYNIVDAPFELVGYGHVENINKTFKFPVKSATVKVGDKVQVVNDGEKIEVIIDRLEVIQNVNVSEYPYSKYDAELKCYRRYREEPIELTDEEYEAIKKVCESDDDASNNNTGNNIAAEENGVATALTIIAWLTYIGGFIMGIALGNVEVGGLYRSYTEFSFAVALVYWCVALVSGTMFLGFAEIIKLLTSILEVTEGTVLHDMIYITFMYGFRRSELMGLKWSAIDFENDTLTVRHTVVLQNVIVAKDKTKNKSSERVYPLLSDVKEILLRRKAQQEEYKKIFGDCYNDTGYVFVKEDGSTYYPSYPTHTLDKTLDRYNLPHIRWHDLRHSCASMLLLKGWSMKDISEWLGHADIGTTMNIYGHLDLEHKRTIGNTLNGLLDK